MDVLIPWTLTYFLTIFSQYDSTGMSHVVIYNGAFEKSAGLLSVKHVHKSPEITNKKYFAVTFLPQRLMNNTQHLTSLFVDICSEDSRWVVLLLLI
jgi:hypothetical protein